MGDFAPRVRTPHGARCYKSRNVAHVSAAAFPGYPLGNAARVTPPPPRARTGRAHASVAGPARTYTPHPWAGQPVYHVPPVIVRLPPTLCLLYYHEPCE
mgnify:CR=1 FL=1